MSLATRYRDLPIRHKLQSDRHGHRGRRFDHGLWGGAGL